MVQAALGQLEGETVYPDSVKSCSLVVVADALQALVAPSSMGAEVVLKVAQQLLVCALVKELFQTAVVNSKKRRGEEEVVSLRCFCS